VKPPPLLSEDTGTPPFTGCTFCSAVMMGSYGGISLPFGVTTAEHYALARAAGKMPGRESATLADIQVGYQKRYGVQAHLFAGNINDLKALGDVYALVQGVYSDLPIHYRRWDPSFTGIHAAGYMPPIAWWQDPLARQREIMAGFNGESMAMGVLDAYALGYGGSIHALYLRANEFSSGAGPADPVEEMKYNFAVLPGPSGSFITGSDPLISYINLETGITTRAPNTHYSIAHPIRLDTPVPGTGDRQTAYLVGPAGEAVAVLATDGKFTPSEAAPSAISAIIAFSDGTKQQIGG